MFARTLPWKSESSCETCVCRDCKSLSDNVNSEFRFARSVACTMKSESIDAASDKRSESAATFANCNAAILATKDCRSTPPKSVWIAVTSESSAFKSPMMIARAALSVSACAARSAASALIARVIAASISSESTTARRSLSSPATTFARSAILSLSKSIRDARETSARAFVSIPDRSRLLTVFSMAVTSLSRLMIVVLCWFC